LAVAIHAAPPITPLLLALARPGEFDASSWLVTALTAGAWALAVLQPHDSWSRGAARVVVCGYWLRWLFLGLMV
jgi:hypothetical protein